MAGTRESMKAALIVVQKTARCSVRPCKTTDQLHVLWQLVSKITVVEVPSDEFRNGVLV